MPHWGVNMRSLRLADRSALGFLYRGVRIDQTRSFLSPRNCRSTHAINSDNNCQCAVATANSRASGSAGEIVRLRAEKVSPGSFRESINAPRFAPERFSRVNPRRTIMLRTLVPPEAVADRLSVFRR